MTIEGGDILKIGICFLLLGFVFAAIIQPLLFTDSPDAVTAMTFMLILSLGILFALSPNPQQPVCTAYQFGISPRSPPSR